MQSMLERLQARSAENAARAARSEQPTSKGTKRVAVEPEPVAEPRLPRAAKTKAQAKQTAEKSESEDDDRPRVAKKRRTNKDKDADTDSDEEKGKESFVEEEPESTFVCLSTALGSEYCLSKADLTSLKVRLVPNPHYRSAAPMQLYDRAAVLAIALAKHGSMEGIAAAAAKREAKAAKAAATREHNDGWREGANPRRWSPATHRHFTGPFKSSIKAFVMAAHVRKIFGGVDAHAELVKRVVKLVVESREVPTRAKQAAKPPKQRNHGYGRYRW